MLISTNLFFKCEFLQKSGSFKARGAINNIISQDQNKFNKGITAVSAGNHAIAASFVANQFKLKNKIFLYESANKYRVQTCKNYGANIIFTNPKQAFLDAENAKNEGYYFIHPFDGPLTLQGSATLGLEIVEYLKSINTKIDLLIKKMDNFIPTNPRPSLLHGDLWEGNILFKNKKFVGFIDPGSFYGHNELEISYLRWFNPKFIDENFLDKYSDHIKIDKYYLEYEPIYQLYYSLLNVYLWDRSYIENVQGLLDKIKI